MDVRDARGEYRIEPAAAASTDGALRGYKRTEMGIIPDDWGLISLLDLAERKKELFDDGDWIEAKFLTDQGVRLIQTGNIGEGSFADKDSKKYISPESFKQLRCKELQVGDILICRLAEPAGRACILPDLGEKQMITAVDVTIFRPPTDVANRRFLVSLLSTSQWFKAVAERCGGTTRTRISRGELGKICVPLPKPQEQRAIAEALSDADALISALDRLIAKKRDLKQAVMQQLLTGQTRLPGFSKKWEMKRLGDHAAFLKHGVNSRAELTPDGEVKYLHYGDIHGADGLLLDPCSSQMPHLPKSKAGGLDRLADGDLVFADASEDVDGVGKSVELCGTANIEVVAGMHTVAVRFDKQVLADGFKAYLQFIPTFRQHLRRLAAGTKVYATNKAHVASAEVLLPEVEEQIAIAVVFADKDAEIQALETRRAKTRDLKQAMMQELLTGRTRLV